AARFLRAHEAERAVLDVRLPGPDPAQLEGAEQCAAVPLACIADAGAGRLLEQNLRLAGARRLEPIVEPDPVAATVRQWQQQHQMDREGHRVNATISAQADLGGPERQLGAPAVNLERNTTRDIARD